MEELFSARNQANCTSYLLKLALPFRGFKPALLLFNDLAFYRVCVLSPENVGGVKVNTKRLLDVCGRSTQGLLGTKFFLFASGVFPLLHLKTN
jgi:hypothetical protein